AFIVAIHLIKIKLYLDGFAKTFLKKLLIHQYLVWLCQCEQYNSASDIKVCEGQSILLYKIGLSVSSFAFHQFLYPSVPSQYYSL
ncbi:hypothetical protein, partial [Pontibacter rugosus]